MKEYIKKDIGDYFFERTNDFEMSPPEHLWENIRKEIAVPQIPAKPHFLRFWQYYTISAFVGIIAVSAYFLTKSEVTTTNLVAENVSLPTPVKTTDLNIVSTQEVANENTTNINNINLTQPEIIESQKKEIITKNTSEKVIDKTSTDVNSNVVNSDNSKLNTSSNTNVTKINSIKKYNINASSFKNVKQIYFVNDAGEKSIVVNNPTINKFGFFEIDVTSLLSGKYRIKIVTDIEEIEHKIESFN